MYLPVALFPLEYTYMFPCGRFNWYFHIYCSDFTDDDDDDDDDEDESEEDTTLDTDTADEINGMYF